MNAGIDVPTIQRFGALYIASARLKSMSKWRTIIAAVDIGNPLFYLIAVGIGIGVLVEQGSGTSGTNGIKYIAFIAPALLANTAITGIMDETVFPTMYSRQLKDLSGANFSSLRIQLRSQGDRSQLVFISPRSAARYFQWLFTTFFCSPLM